MGGRKKINGFTLMEMLAVVAAVAVLACIAIPSLLHIRAFLRFQENNRYARTVFLAAQGNLTRLRSEGALEAWGLPAVRQSGDDAETDWRYVATGEEDFAQILPQLSVEETLRQGGMVIEFDCRTLSVCAVFYDRADTDLGQRYREGTLTREETARRKLGLGYFVGGGLAAATGEAARVRAELFFSNGQAAVVTVAVPMQTSEGIPLLENRYGDFMEGLEITLTVTGERGGSFRRVIKPYGTISGCALGSTSGGVRAVLVSTVLDSLTWGGGFGNLSSGMAEPLSEGDFAVLPGDNVTVRAEVRFTSKPGDPVIDVEGAALAGVNPMFASLTENSTGGYVLEIANGRNLQNLNALAPSIGKDVDTVVFTAPDGTQDITGKRRGGCIDWQETADYYGGQLRFVPIYNPCLFGAVDKNAFPLLKDRMVRTNYAQILGNGVKIYNLNIDLGQSSALPRYTEAAQTGYAFAGLFGYINTRIDGLFVVNPVIRGSSGEGICAAGGLLGGAGPDTRISGCGVYIDTGAADYSASRLDMAQFSGQQDAYGVSGFGAVGGLVGCVHGDDAALDTITGSFAAVPVHAVMRQDARSGYTDGVGGLVGNARLVRFQKCYASGFVSGVGCGYTASTFSEPGFAASGYSSHGAGGFVGTAQACRFENCFASGNVRGEILGGFVGVMCYDAGETDGRTLFYRCYGVGLASDGEKTYESFFGINALLNSPENRIHGDYYEAAVPHYLRYGDMEPEAYLFRDCHYLSGNLPGADYESGASVLCANPESYETLCRLHEKAADSLTQLKNTPFRSEGELSVVKALLETLAADREGLAAVLERYEERGTFQIYFDALPYLTAGQDLSRRLTSRYGAAFPKGIWGEAAQTFGYDASQSGESYPFSMLNGLPYYGNWPEKGPDTGDFGILYYERGETGVGFRMVSLADGRVRTENFSGNVEEAGYALYYPAGTKPFSQETWALLGEPLTGLQEAADLPGTYEIRKILAETAAGAEGNPALVWVTNRDGSQETWFVPGFADTIGQTGDVFRIHCPSQLAQIARFPAGHFLVEGTVELNGDQLPIPSFSGTLTGTADSRIRITEGTNGLFENLSGTLENLTVSGRFRLSGTKGVLCHVLAETGKIRSCCVEAEITAENVEAVGTIAGRTAGGLISDTAVKVSASGETFGLFAGFVGAGTFQNCSAETEDGARSFVLDGEILREKTVENATHMGFFQLSDGVVTAEEADDLTETLAPKREYRAAFENCRLIRDGETYGVPRPVWYYRLTPVGGKKLVPVEEMGPNAPKSGTFLLVTGDGTVLSAERSMILRREFPEGDPAPGICWEAGESGWTCLEGGVILQVARRSGQAVRVTYEEETALEVTEYAPDGSLTTQTVTRLQTRQVLCRLYAVEPNTDWRLKQVDSGSLLWEG